MRFFTGIEIHRRQDRAGLFIDHGMGVGLATAEVGEEVTLYHTVTLGGTAGKANAIPPSGIGDDRRGSKVLGPIEIGCSRTARWW
jgi:serine O-acetyltransferase